MNDGFAIGLLLVVLATGAGCATNGAVQRAGAKVDQASTSTARAFKKGGEQTVEGLSKAKQAIVEGAKKTGEKLKGLAP